MIGGNSTEAEGTSEKGMIVRNLVNRGDRRKVRATRFHWLVSPLFQVQQRNTTGTVLHQIVS
jgi:hypothetical protein